MKKLLTCIILLSGCASVQSSGTETRKSKSADNAMDSEQRKLDILEERTLAEIDLDYVASWRRVHKSPIEIRESKKILKVWKKTISVLRLGDGISTRSESGKYGSFLIDNHGKMFLKCVYKTKEMKDGVCGIRAEGGSFKVGYANTLTLTMDYSSMTFSLVDFQNNTHRYRLE